MSLRMLMLISVCVLSLPFRAFDNGQYADVPDRRRFARGEAVSPPPPKSGGHHRVMMAAPYVKRRYLGASGGRTQRHFNIQTQCRALRSLEARTKRP